MSWWSDIWNWFKPKPKPVKWNLGITVNPPEATVTLTIDNGMIVFGKRQGDSSQFLLALSNPPHPIDYGGNVLPTLKGYTTSPMRANTLHPGITIPGAYQLPDIQMRPVKPLPQPRSPLVLPTCGSCPSPMSYDKEMLWTPPKNNRSFLRADCWGIPIPGLPFVTGGSSEHPERFLSYFFSRYAREFQDAWLRENALRGYTHIYLSWPDARAWSGQDIPQFVADCKRIKEWGYYVHVKLGSKDFDPHDMNLNDWSLRLDPLLDALFAAQAIDEASFWEYDSFNLDGQPAIDIHKYFGRRCHDYGVSFWCHFLPNHGFWTPQGYQAWWVALGTDVDGLDYQAISEGDVGNLQERIVDHLRDISPDHILRAFEFKASLQFSGDITEDEVNTFGYLACCTKGTGQVWGYGNGGRDLDGGVL